MDPSGRGKMEDFFDSIDIGLHDFPLNVDDAAYYLICNNDIYSQVHAVQRLNNYLLKERDDHSKHIEECKNQVKNSRGIENYFMESDLIDEYHLSSYYSIARSICVVGITAPGYESIFNEIFCNIMKIFGEKTLNNKFNRSKLSPSKRWDCHFYIDDSGAEKKGLNVGIIHLLSETSFIDFLPSDFSLILDALFSYRNAVMHNGFDWPEQEVLKFTTRKKNWPNSWIGVTTVDDKPWLYYLTDEFHSIVINIIGEIYKAAGKYYLHKKGSDI